MWCVHHWPESTLNEQPLSHSFKVSMDRLVRTVVFLLDSRVLSVAVETKCEYRWLTHHIDTEHVKDGIIMHIQDTSIQLLSIFIHLFLFMHLFIINSAVAELWNNLQYNTIGQPPHYQVLNLILKHLYSFIFNPAYNFCFTALFYVF